MAQQAISFQRDERGHLRAVAVPVALLGAKFLVVGPNEAEVRRALAVLEITQSVSPKQRWLETTFECIPPI